MCTCFLRVCLCTCYACVSVLVCICVCVFKVYTCYVSAIFVGGCYMYLHICVNYAFIFVCESCVCAFVSV